MEGTQTSVDEKLEIPRLNSSRGRAIAIVVAVVVVAAAITVYFLTRDTEESPYRVAQVSRTSIVKEIRVTGHLELTDQVEVPAPIEGQLIEVFVLPGDSVEEGQLLARLDKGSGRGRLSRGASGATGSSRARLRGGSRGPTRYRIARAHEASRREDLG